MTADAKTVMVIGIKWVHPNFKTVTVTVIWGKWILKRNKTSGNNFDSNGIDASFEFSDIFSFLGAGFFGGGGIKFLLARVAIPSRPLPSTPPKHPTPEDCLSWATLGCAPITFVIRKQLKV